MMDYENTLFDTPESAHRYEPLASRLRPRDLADFVGQEHLLGKGKLLRNLIENDHSQVHDVRQGR